MAWLQCVPNVSEGRDVGRLRVLADAVEGTGAELRDVHADPDHHRAVFTILGAGAVVERAVLALGRAAVATIDLTRHRGAHPRVGALDVVPFVPLRGARMADAVAAAHRVGQELAEALGVPVFFYGHAAAHINRRELPAVRRGGFERLAERMCQPDWKPDAGPARPHPTAGAVVVGARAPLIAFNAVLETGEVEVAQAVARAVRESSGGLPAVRALGVELRSRGLAQVSMNLLDYRRTGPARAAAAVEAAARAQGARVREYELVGCAPADAFEEWPAGRAPVAGLKARQLLDPGLFRAAA